MESRSVDVAGIDGDQESRNWDAVVLCDYARLLGDVSLSLDVFIQDFAPHRPTEPEFSSSFAATTQSLVLYPAEEDIPSAYWLVTPTGSTTRARLLSSDDEQPRYSLDAVEAAVPQLPDVRVIQLPEIAREQHISTPVTSEFIQTASRLRESSEMTEHFDFADEPGSPAYSARTCLAEWERMVRRMESCWRPTGKYPVGLYSEALLSRDLIEKISEQLPESMADLLRDSTRKVDDKFMECTVRDDRWASVSELPKPLAEPGESNWWWLRKPRNPPWERNRPQ
ncbi:hypothetical protein ACFCV8_25880 [Streptomyces sp. NPDC056347]|uniref:hypothetical protein n=1 Tax=Streptomyces sp. NPDC056347 TaxID=3345790 RepID=UPI0035DECCB3